MIIVETVYRANIAFDYLSIDKARDGDLTKVQLKIEQFARNSGVDVAESFEGNAACGPYVIIESDSELKLKKCITKAVRYVNRFNNVRIY